VQKVSLIKLFPTRRQDTEINVQIIHNCSYSLLTILFKNGRIIKNNIKGEILMKKIALILALVMMFSAVSTLAAPSVEYMFYAENEDMYYVFGTYQNSVVAGTAVNTDELGLIVNDGEIEKTFTYKGLDVQNEKGDTKFGMSFGVPEELSTFKVTPYSVNDVKKENGIEREWDAVNDTRKLSSDATLKYVTISRSYGVNTHFTMTPDFSPEVTSYTVTGSFRDVDAGAGAREMDEVLFSFATTDPKATATLNHTTSRTGTSTITVVPEDNSEPKVYSFTFKVDDKLGYSAGRYTNVSEAGCIHFQGTTTTTTTAQQATYSDVVYYPLKHERERKTTILKFPINETMATLNKIDLSFNAKCNNSTDYKNVTFSVKNVTLTDDYTIDQSKLCYQHVLDGDIVIGEEVAEFTQTSFDTNFDRYSVNVTDAVKTALANDQDYVAFEISVKDLELPANAATNYFMFRLYTTWTNAAYNPILMY